MLSIGGIQNESSRWVSTLDGLSSDSVIINSAGLEGALIDNYSGECLEVVWRCIGFSLIMMARAT